MDYLDGRINILRFDDGIRIRLFNQRFKLLQTAVVQYFFLSAASFYSIFSGSASCDDAVI